MDDFVVSCVCDRFLFPVPVRNSRTRKQAAIEVKTVLRLRL